uniref:Galectin n=1 Tax=Panagrellus redivivus TaxID=6233 RepID=A0A7E4W631_PANRE
MDLTLEDLSVPFYTPLHNAYICIGTSFHFYGELNLKYRPDLEKTFVIELLSYPDVVLHIRFRFHKNYKNYIAINACDFAGFCTSTEKRAKHIPLDDDFHIEIFVDSGYFKILVNGKEIATYNHKFPYQSIKAVGVYGAVIIDKMNIKNNFGYVVCCSGLSDRRHLCSLIK